MEDTSLDEFLSADTDESDDGEVTAQEGDVEEDVADDPSGEVTDTEEQTDGSPGGDGVAADAAEVDTGDEADTVDPATTTSRWTGDGVVCPRCGETVERGWQSVDELICATCKEW